MENEDSGEHDGFFKTFHAKVLKEVSPSDIQFVFEGPTPSEKVKRVQGLNCAKNLKFNLSKKGKSKVDAEKFRNEGNKFFQKGEFEKALKFYSLSVILAPPFSNETMDTTLSLAFANRSAALFHLKLYKLAISDIGEALRSSYPENLHHKVYERRGKCQLEVGNGQEAMQDLQVTLGLLEKMKTDEKIEKQKEELKKLIERCKSLKKKDSKQKVSELPTFTKSTNAGHTCASNSVEIRESPDAGRHAVAARDIAVGELLLVEKPYVSVQQPKKYSTHCHHCLRVLQAPVPCPGCTRISFCSPECRTLACCTYHKVECELIDPLWYSGISITCYLALRTVSQFPPQFFDEPENNKLGAVQSLVGHSERREPADYFNNSLMAMFLLDCLVKAGYFREHEDLVDKVGGKLLSYLEILQFNTHEVSELSLEKRGEYKTAKTVFLGAAIYPTLALFNHSCEPGVVRYHIGTTVVARAIKPIAKGETINENYGPIFSQMHRSVRQQTLKERYWFECSCQPCLESWPLFEGLEEQPWKFRCGTCRKGNPVSFDSLDPVINCSNCSATINMLKGLKTLQETEDIFKKGNDLLDKAELPRAQTCFEDLLSTMSEVLSPPFKDYLNCQESLRKCYIALGNTNVK